MNIGIIVNFSYSGFDEQAKRLKEELEKLGNSTETLTNKQATMLSDDSLKFEKCIFLDKDIPLGLRLEMLGKRLYNNIGSVELCDDKRRTYELVRHDFKTPLSFSAPLSFCESDATDFLDTVAERLGFPLVAKNAFGSLGNEVFLIKDRNELYAFYAKNSKIPHLYQQFIEESFGRDMRIYVVGGKVQAGIIRTNKNDFRANIALGGEAQRLEITPAVAELSQNVSNLLGLDFCGVDLLFSNDGTPYICEVNSNALFKKMSEISGINIAAAIAAHINEDKKQTVLDIQDLF